MSVRLMKKIFVDAVEVKVMMTLAIQMTIGLANLLEMMITVVPVKLKGTKETEKT